MAARWSGVSRFGLPVALAAALALVVMLARQKIAQDQRYARLQENSTLPKRGVFVPTFTTRSLDGPFVTISERPESGKQVLFLFTTTCAYCQASLRAVREIATAASEMLAPSVTMVGIVLDSIELARTYAAANALRFPIVEFPSRKLRHLYRARAVPIILVLDSEGRIVFRRDGVLNERIAVDSVLTVVQTTDRVTVVARRDSGSD